MGAILRRFLSPVGGASFSVLGASVSASSLLRLPGVRLSSNFGGLGIEADGVCGAVVTGAPPTDVATFGTAPTVGVGLFIAAGEAIAPTEDTDEDRAGDADM